MATSAREAGDTRLKKSICLHQWATETRKKSFLSGAKGHISAFTYHPQQLSSSQCAVLIPQLTSCSRKH